jgi:hypothetical protein
VAHHLHTHALRPDAELVGRGRAKGVARGEQHFLAVGFQIEREFPDTGGLPHAVDADDDDRAWLC